MTTEPIIIPYIIGQCVDYVNTKVAPIVVRYTYGRQINILDKLVALNNSTDLTIKATKYPLLALYFDFDENNRNGSYYIEVNIPRIQIACLTNLTDEIPDRYPKTFLPILYPIYKYFLEGLARNKNVVGNSPDNIIHTKTDSPGNQLKGAGLTDYVDAINLRNLILKISQTKTC